MDFLPLASLVPLPTNGGGWSEEETILEGTVDVDPLPFPPKPLQRPPVGSGEPQQQRLPMPPLVPAMPVVTYASPAISMSPPVLAASVLCAECRKPILDPRPVRSPCCDRLVHPHCDACTASAAFILSLQPAPVHTTSAPQVQPQPQPDVAVPDDSETVEAASALFGLADAVQRPRAKRQKPKREAAGDTGGGGAFTALRMVASALAEDSPGVDPRPPKKVPKKSSSEPKVHKTKAKKKKKKGAKDGDALTTAVQEAAEAAGLTESAPVSVSTSPAEAVNAGPATGALGQHDGKGPVIPFSKIDLASPLLSLCSVCGASAASAKDMVTCVDCCESFHVYCLDSCLRDARPAWRCSVCKVCEHCHRSAGAEKLICCDICDAAFHASCLPPTRRRARAGEEETAPAGLWGCERCTPPCAPPPVRVTLPLINPKAEDGSLPPWLWCEFVSPHKERSRLRLVIKAIITPVRPTSPSPPAIAALPAAESALQQPGVPSSMTLNSDEMEAASALGFLATQASAPAPPCMAARPQSPVPPVPEPMTPPCHPSAEPEQMTLQNRPKPVVDNGNPSDARACALCGIHGDTELLERLLPLDVDTWVHLNCVMWSRSFDPREDGGIANVRPSLAAALARTCAHCGRPGASVLCAKKSCPKAYHLVCALNCCFLLYDGGDLVCWHHQTAPIYGSPGSLRKRMYIADAFAAAPGSKRKPMLPARRGNFILFSVGKPSERRGTVTPLESRIGWKSARLFWDVENPKVKSLFVNEIVAPEGHRKTAPPFSRVTLVRGNGSRGPTFIGPTPSDVWEKIVVLVNRQLPEGSRLRTRSGEFYFGFTNNWVLQPHKPAGKKGAREIQAEEPAENQSGCARAEGIELWRRLSAAKPRAAAARQAAAAAAATSARHSHASFAGLAGGLPVAMRFRQMASAAQKLEVRRSDIQGLGVFAKTHIEPDVMLLEYKGEVIRQSVADIREERYRRTGTGLGDYMFSLADGMVVDATIRGSSARFVNHSCDPNCETKIITVGGKKHIVIVSKTDIFPNEELSYDYKFPLEDDGSKVKCNCGAARCFGFMN